MSAAAHDRRTAYQRTLDALDQHGSTVRTHGEGRAVAQCPAHPDGNPSLSLRRIEGSLLLHCHAGCTSDDVLAALDLTRADLYDEPAGATYAYDDGRLVHRTPDKRFRQSGNTAARPQLYRLTQVTVAVAEGRTVYVVEGEKDVHALESLGTPDSPVTATTAPQGAANAAKADWSPLHGAHVVLVPDRDPAGLGWARAVHGELADRAARLDLRLPAVVAAKADPADHVAAGHTLDDLLPGVLPDPDPEPVADGHDDDMHDAITARMRDGATFVLDAPDKVPAVWGHGDEVLWAEGESLMIVGPPGVGKTTIVGQIVRGRLGLQPTVLGWEVAPTAARVLYLAMDRPAQIARSLRRVFVERDRQVLADRLVVWPGPPPSDVAKFPDTLVGLARLAGADTVIVDSLKDAAIGLTDDEVGASYNRARQMCVTNGVEVVELHHLVKRGPGGAKPRELADVYGSMHLTAGAGSVLLVWGAAGDPIVEVDHLKQPAEPVGPVRVIHDHDAGTSQVWHGLDLLEMALAAARRPEGGLTAKATAVALFEADDPTPSQVEKARRRLVGMERSGVLVQRPGTRGGSDKSPAVWVAATTREPVDNSVESHSRSHSRGGSAPDALTPSDPIHGSGVSAGQGITVPFTPFTGQAIHVSPPLSIGGEREAEWSAAHCEVCGDPLHDRLAAAGETTHPTCHPDQQPEADA